MHSMIIEYAERGAQARLSTFQHYTTLLEKTGIYIAQQLQSGRKLLLIGNGGSASEAQHIAAEYVGRFSRRERIPLPAIALTTDSSILTAIGNDYGFDMIFEKQIEALGRAGDILIVSSTSGNSPNCIRALQQAHIQGIYTIGLTAQSGGAMKEVCDVLFAVHAEHTPIVQEIHIALQHMLCAIVEQHLPKEYDRV